MDLLNYQDVTSYVQNKQVYFKKEIANSEFRTIAEANKVHNIGNIDLTRLNKEQIALTITINGLETTITRDQTDEEFYTWIKQTLIPIDVLIKDRSTKPKNNLTNNVSETKSSGIEQVDNQLFEIPQIKLSYSRESTSRVKIKSIHQAYSLFKLMWNDDMDYLESAYLLLLTGNLSVIGMKPISKGGTSATVIDSKLILQTALLSNASLIVLAHNHPCGNTTPSQHDIKTTKSIKRSAKLMGLHLLDHLVITSEGFTSMNDQKLI